MKCVLIVDGFKKLWQKSCDIEILLGDGSGRPRRLLQLGFCDGMLGFGSCRKTCVALELDPLHRDTAGG